MPIIVGQRQKVDIDVGASAMAIKLARILAPCRIALSVTPIAVELRP